MKHFAPHISITIALAVLFGVAVHDTKLDTMTAFAIAVPVMVASYEGAHAVNLFSSDAHTHVERISLAENVRAVTHSAPSLQPRQHEDTRFRTPKATSKGHYPFDNYSLPAIA